MLASMGLSGAGHGPFCCPPVCWGAGGLDVGRWKKGGRGRRLPPPLPSSFSGQQCQTAEGAGAAEADVAVAPCGPCPCRLTAVRTRSSHAAQPCNWMPLFRSL